MSAATVVKLDLARRYLALLLQGSPALNGHVAQLDTSVIPRPLNLLAEIIRKIAAEHHEFPSPDNLSDIVTERSHAKGPAEAELIRREFAALSQLTVTDPNLTVERMEVDAHNCRLARLAAEIDNALTLARARGERADVSEQADALHETPAAGPVHAPRLAAPRLDLDALAHLVPYFQHIQDAFRPTTDAPVEFLTAAGLVAAAAAVGKRYYLRLGTDVIYANLWLALLADSTLPRKTTALGITHYCQHKSHGEWTLPRAGSPEGFVQALVDRNGAGVQIISELGGWLKAMDRAYMAGFKEVLTELYDSIPKFDAQRTRKKVAGEKEKQVDSDVITWPALSLFGASTRGWLNSNLTDADVQSGFLARWLFVPVDRRTRGKMAATRRQVPQAEAVQQIVGTLQRLQDGPEHASAEGPPGRHITLQNFAKGYYEHWVQQYPRDVPEAAPFYERLETTVLKLALLCARLQGSDTEILRPAMQAACLLGDFFAKSIGYVLGSELALGLFAQQKQKVLSLLEAAPGRCLAKQVLYWKTGWDKKTLDRVLEVLVEEGSIRKTPGGHADRRGRKGEVYALPAPVVTS